MNVIETIGLSRTYGRNEALHALDLQIDEGATLALLGSNGSGKSTTIKLLMNRIQPTSGRALVFGREARLLGPASLGRIGYVSEALQLPAWLSVRQYLDYCRSFYPLWDRALEAELLGRFDLPPERRIKDLSRGMRMKVALVSVLAYRPSLLVLDEPLSGLDPLVRDEFTRGLLTVASQEGCTTLIASHDIDDIERIVDQVALLDAGHLHLNESLASLTTRHRRVEIGSGDRGRPALPGTMDWESSGQLTRFVATDYVPGRSEQAWRERFPGSEVTTLPLTLREIVLVSIRALRAEPKGTP